MKVQKAMNGVDGLIQKSRKQANSKRYQQPFCEGESLRDSALTAVASSSF